jgi:hypothetical protein
MPKYIYVDPMFIFIYPYLYLFTNMPSHIHKMTCVALCDTWE